MIKDRVGSMSDPGQDWLDRLRDERFRWYTISTEGLHRFLFFFVVAFFLSLKEESECSGCSNSHEKTLVLIFFSRCNVLRLKGLIQFNVIGFQLIHLMSLMLNRLIWLDIVIGDKMGFELNWLGAATGVGGGGVWWHWWHCRCGFCGFCGFRVGVRFDAFVRLRPR